MMLETQLLQLKKTSDWWTGGGVCIMITGGIYFIFSQFVPLTVPLIILGIFVLIKGVFLQSAWVKLNKRYMSLLSAEYQMARSQVPQVPLR